MPEVGNVVNFEQLFFVDIFLADCIYDKPAARKVLERFYNRLQAGVVSIAQLSFGWCFIDIAGPNITEFAGKNSLACFGQKRISLS